MLTPQLPEHARLAAVALLQGGAGSVVRNKIAVGTPVFTMYGEGVVAGYRPTDLMYEVKLKWDATGFLREVRMCELGEGP